jgi:hypothetical protein
MTGTYKTNLHAKKGRRHRAQHAPKEEATFDAGLQRYVMLSERSATMSKQDTGE